jgi:hypothetical protein
MFFLKEEYYEDRQAFELQERTLTRTKLIPITFSISGRFITAMNMGIKHHERNARRNC